MNYQLHYDNIIKKLRNRVLPKDAVVEKHHIIPRSMGGNNSKENLIDLTPREHYVAHHLLWKIHRNQSMACAFWNMSTTRIDGVDYRINSSTYEAIRKDISRLAKERMADPEVRNHLRNLNLNHPVSEETRNKISNALKGKVQPKEYVEKRRQSVIDSPKSKKGKTLEELYGLDRAEEMRKNMSISQTGKVVSPETAEKQRQAMLGKTHTEETKEKISQANKGKVRSEESRKNISESHKGLKLSEEQKEKISKSLKGKKKSEETKQKMRKPKTEEHKRKISEAKQRKKLEFIDDKSRNV